MPTLDWLNRADAFTIAARVPYRLLEPVSSHGTGADNLLIQGDNLEALKALLPFYRGQVKCIFIDPPYNTKSAFEHYDDNLEHSQWLSMMLPRLQLLRELLREDGSIWVTIDDNEGHYLKVLMDEVFGRGNFVANVVWQKRIHRKSMRQLHSDDHDHVFVRANETAFVQASCNAPKTRSQLLKILTLTPRPMESREPIAGKIYCRRPTSPIVKAPNRGDLFAANQPLLAMQASPIRGMACRGRITFWSERNGRRPMLKKFLDAYDGWPNSNTWWAHMESGSNKEASKASSRCWKARRSLSNAQA
jgi:adenine-specific DNA-methyltransferase